MEKFKCFPVDILYADDVGTPKSSVGSQKSSESVSESESERECETGNHDYELNRLELPAWDRSHIVCSADRVTWLSNDQKLTDIFCLYSRGLPVGTQEEIASEAFVCGFRSIEVYVIIPAPTESSSNV